MKTLSLRRLGFRTTTSGIVAPEPGPELTVVLDESPQGEYVATGVPVRFRGYVSDPSATVSIAMDGGATLGGATVDPITGWFTYDHTFSSPMSATDFVAVANGGIAESAAISLTVNTLDTVAGNAALVDWWRADLGVNGGRTAWTGQKNGHIFAEATNVPTASTLTQSGLAALAGNGTDTVYTNTSAISTLAGNDRAFSIGILLEPIGTPNGAAAPTVAFATGASTTQPYMRIFGWTGSQNYPLFQRRADSGGAATAPNPGTTFANLFSAGSTYWVMVCFSGTTVRTYVNGVLVHTDAACNTTGDLTLTGWTLFAQVLGGVLAAPASVKIGEVALWNSDQQANADTIWRQYARPRYFDSVMPGVSIVTSNATAKSAVCNTIVSRAIASRGTEQITGWYDSELTRVWIAKRTIGTRDWVTTITGLDRVAPASDSHNVIAFALDSADFWHIWADMHNDSHRHQRGASVGDINYAAFGAFPLVPGSTTESSVTYPEPIRQPSGTLVELYRYGTSGAGDAYVIQTADGTNWTHVAQLTDVTGGSLSPYFNQVCVNQATGVWTLSWTYRANGSNNNLDLYCIRFDPATGVATKIDGSAQTLPVTTGNLSPLVDIPDEGGLINNQAMVLDGAGNPIIVCHHDNGTNDTQINAYRWNGSTWTKTVLTSFATPYHFDVTTPFGLDAMRLSRPHALYRDGKLFVIFTCSELGPGIWCLRGDVGTGVGTTVANIDFVQLLDKPVGLWEPGGVDRARWFEDDVLAMNVMNQPFVLANTVASLDPIDANAQAQMFGVFEMSGARLAA